MTHPITHVATTDLSDMLNPQGGPRMSLPGFDAEFVDFPDYIIRITDRIWHERKVELCLKYYSEDCLIHTQSGDIIGAQTVVDNTYTTMKAYPDRTLDADNVIWSEVGDDIFYSSHLITSKMTNLGPSEFGPATGKKVRVFTIADCAVRANRIFEEWLVRDYAAIVLQLGFNVDDIAGKLAKDDIEKGYDLIAFHADNFDLTTQKPHVKAANETQSFITAFFDDIWNAKDFAKLGDYYDFRVGAKYPGLRDFYGHDEVGHFFDELLTALSDTKLRIEHLADIPYLGEARDVAVRWSLAGTHSGEGFYGEPTHAPVYIMGVSQFRIIRGRIREEVTVWDDVAVRRMIEGARLRG